MFSDAFLMTCMSVTGPLYVCGSLFKYSTVDAYLSWFQIFAAIHNTSVTFIHRATAIDDQDFSECSWPSIRADSISADSTNHGLQNIF